MSGAELARESEGLGVDFLEAVRTRVADGPKPRQMVVTLLADYWLDEGATVPSGALVDLAADFGISQAGARTVLGRLARDERVVVAKEGRRTLYCLTDGFRRRLLTGLDRMRTFGREDQDLGRWTWVAFSVPEGQRAVRHKLRRGLQWIGFAPLYDGLWVSPRQVAGEVEALIHGLGIASAAVFTGDAVAAGSEYGRPTDAWDLPTIRDTYDLFLAETEPILAATREGAFDDRQALLWRTQLINVWRVVPNLDPGLPSDLLPAGWPRERARGVFEELYDALAEPAQRRVRAAVARHSTRHADEAVAHALALGSAGR